MATRIFVGDCREVLKGIPDGWYHTVCTSPPYWGLRSYLGPDDPDKALELGSEETPELYVAHLVEVFREVWRVLRDDGTVWLNLGDSFASGKGTCYNPGGGVSSLGQERKAAGAHPLNRGNKSTLAQSGLKPKDLVGIPWRVALALQADGWWLRSDIIWNKPNCMPESVTDRPTKSHEYMFLLTKSARYYFDADAVREQAKPESAARYGYSFFDTPKHQTGGYSADGAKHTPGMKPFDGGRNIRSVWTIPTHSFKGAHFATFPPALVTPCIKAGSSQRGCCPSCGSPWQRATTREFVPQQDVSQDKGIRGAYDQKPMDASNSWQGFPRGTTTSTTTGWRPTCTCNALPPVPCRVCDIFGGVGTVALVARHLGRDCDLIELNASYAEMAQQRLDNTPVHVVETDDGKIEVQQVGMF